MQNDIPALDKKGLRDFGLLTGAIFIVLFGLIIPFVIGAKVSLWPYVIGGILIFWGLVLPRSLNPVYMLWMKFGIVIGWVMNRVVLFVFFYLILFPVSMIMKMIGRDPMNRKFDQTIHSYRVITKQRDSLHMQKPY